jgi:hypothetical protein
MAAHPPGQVASDAVGTSDAMSLTSLRRRHQAARTYASFVRIEEVRQRARSGLAVPRLDLDASASTCGCAAASAARMFNRRRQ